MGASLGGELECVRDVVVPRVDLKQLAGGAGGRPERAVRERERRRLCVEWHNGGPPAGAVETRDRVVLAIRDPG